MHRTPLALRWVLLPASPCQGVKQELEEYSQRALVAGKPHEELRVLQNGKPLRMATTSVLLVVERSPRAKQNRIQCSTAVRLLQVPHLPLAVVQGVFHPSPSKCVGLSGAMLELELKSLCH